LFIYNGELLSLDSQVQMEFQLYKYSNDQDAFNGRVKGMFTWFLRVHFTITHQIYNVNTNVVERLFEPG